MLDKRTKLIMAMCLLLGLALGLCLGIGGIFIKSMAENKKNVSEGELPIKAVVITIDKSQQEELFDQLRKFADKHGFAIRIAPTTPSGEDFSVAMWRSDVKIIGANPFDKGTFDIPFYNNNCTFPVPESVVDDLISELRSFVDEIPKATFSVEE